MKNIPSLGTKPHILSSLNGILIPESQLGAKFLLMDPNLVNSVEYSSLGSTVYEKLQILGIKIHLMSCHESPICSTLELPC